MQVLMSSKPSFQSFWPDSVSSLARGGTDTGEAIDSVVVAPSIKEPPRKQTRWSCLGNTCHDLLISIREGNLASQSQKVSIHLTSSSVGNKLHSICNPWFEAFPNETIVNCLHGILVHLSGGRFFLKDFSSEARNCGSSLLPRDRLVQNYSVYELGKNEG